MYNGCRKEHKKNIYISNKLKPCFQTLFLLQNSSHLNIVSFFRWYRFVEFAEVENVGAGHSNAKSP